MSLTTTSGMVVPAGDYAVAFTPIGGSKESFVGVLPTASNGEIPGGTIPPAWINPKNGLPYQLTMGWVGSTGGATDIHEITQAEAETLSGKLPGLAASLSVQGAATHATATYTLHAATTASGGPETQSIVVTDTFPLSVTPRSSGAGGTGWVCSLTGQKVTCTYAVSGALAPGTALPPLSMPVTVDDPAGTTITDTAASGLERRVSDHRLGGLYGAGHTRAFNRRAPGHAQLDADGADPDARGSCAGHDRARFPHSR